ncbi:hypothetical protein NDN08_002458 [Rhodosorus marinus]|uniref:BZIP domain-containing protein n=1 Tax=Rhodosorus marinus TaxID=101924 RepID=A0AAV8UXB9_9RHOD|nr:hypothetical protein NDN08_002458 [Rhodosorus marinus]
MDPGVMYLNMELIDSFGENVKEEALPSPPMSNPSSFGSLVSLESPRAASLQKRACLRQDTFRPEKKQKLGRKTKNSGLRAERNRQSAAASRERSKRHLTELERLSMTLPDANVRLTNSISRIVGQNDTARSLKAENAVLVAKVEKQQQKLAELEQRLAKCSKEPLS